ncbi:MAG TPA: lytic transglycosylase domain-containing protein [Thermohalobaculum sp.]|nr:lytic transglycosylase domain-containing protein [Thermohalobaculum sp.]
MLSRITGFFVAFIVVAFLPPAQAAALDLAAARSSGALTAEALAKGGRGDWSGAEALAARYPDQVVRDIVLWRKLRAGAGTVLEYQSFATRRGTWPGQDQLARAVFGQRIPVERPGSSLSGAAADRWATFRDYFRRDRYDEAERFLAGITDRAEALGLPAVWADRRQSLARRAARQGRAEVAYRLASLHHLRAQDGYDYAELEWLAGWIALRKLDDPKRALPHFHRFYDSVESPISLGRGNYWLGRAYEAAGDKTSAAEWYLTGAIHQTSFYGQLAAARAGVAGDPLIASGELPDWSKTPALRSDEVRAAVILHYAGESALAFAFFSDLGKRLEGDAALGALARLALDLGQPHFAVRVAKHAARKGTLLYPAYYPITDLAGYASTVEPALAMAIARQETELNPRAVSPAGARGLMQLMPATAKKVAGWIGEKYSRQRLTEDWQYNARLGQTYLARRIGEFDGSYVLAAAAYNAGAHRVQSWIGEYGDPRLPGVDMIDWMESIPFSETRNYVQRVLEALYVYRARITGTTGPMTIVADLARGVRG